MVRDINPGPGFSEPRGFVAVNGSVFFTAHDAEHGNELWKTDGTEAGTKLVADLNPGPARTGVYGLLPVGDRVFFVAWFGVPHEYSLWESDGTEAGTRKVRDGELFGAVAVGDTLLFVAGDGNLWRTDGTESGTVLVKNFDGGGYLRNFTVMGDVAYFTREGASPGTSELWRSDRTDPRP